MRNASFALTGSCLFLAATMSNAAQLRLADGRPVVGVYYFGHWWEPWKSNDDAIRNDLNRLRKMGVTVLFADHEWSQAIDGDWRWLDREHRLAREAGLVIVPWLSLKTFSDVAPGRRQELAKKWFGVDLVYGVDQDGKPAAPLPYHPQTLEFAVKWTKAYIERYREQGALAHVRLNGREGVWVCPTVEIAWVGPGSFDPATVFMFVRHLKSRYRSVAELNKTWGVDYRSFWDVAPRDKRVFDFPGATRGKAVHSAAVRDWVAFCSQLLNDSLERIGAAIRREVPDVVIGTETPYQLGSAHPHAAAYRIGYAADSASVEHAEILVVRATGPLTPEEIALQDAYRKRGHAVVLAYRTYRHWSVFMDRPDAKGRAESFAAQAAEHADGLGFYSWNEMVDTHVAPGTVRKEVALTPARSEQSVRFLESVVKHYLGRGGSGRSD